MAKHKQLLIALVLGAGLGVCLHPYAANTWLLWISGQILQPVGQIFLRMIFMTLVPLIFTALVLGVYELGKSQGLGRVSFLTLVFTAVLSTLSVFIGIGLVNILKPGVGYHLDPTVIQTQSSALMTVEKNVSNAKSFSESIVDLIPRNPIDSAARALDGEILAVMVYALIFGLALTKVIKEDPVKKQIIPFFETIFAVSMKMVEFALLLAPFGVFSIIFNTTFRSGGTVIMTLLFYVCTVLTGLLLQQFAVYTFMLKSFTRFRPLDFFSKCREVYLYGFSTASSNATLPLSLETAEHKLGLQPEISRFVLTIGASANQNGTALFEGVTVLFLAQVYGIDLSLAQQIKVVFMSILAGVGTAGVPGGSLPLIAILLHSLGIPPEGIGLILGVDRFLDMCRTTLNISGDLVIAALISENVPAGRNDMVI